MVTIVLGYMPSMRLIPLFFRCKDIICLVLFCPYFQIASKKTNKIIVSGEFLLHSFFSIIYFWIKILFLETSFLDRLTP